MDGELEDLDSLHCKHFGGTPTTAQVSDNDVDQLASETDDYGSSIDNEEPEESTDEQARMFLQENTSSMPRSEMGEIDSGPLVVNIKTFLSSGCGCSRKCSAAFSESEVYSHVLNVRDMKRKDRDMYAMATIASYTEQGSTKRGLKRERHVREFDFQGITICKKTLMLLFDIGKHTFLSLCNHVSENGVVPRLHASTGKKPSNALTFPDVRNVIQFLSNFAETFGVVQPAASSGGDGLAPIYLKSNLKKVTLHERYEVHCLEANPPCRVVKYSTFNNIWRACLGHIKIATPRSDKCAKSETMQKKEMTTNDIDARARKYLQENTTNTANDIDARARKFLQGTTSNTSTDIGAWARRFLQENTSNEADMPSSEMNDSGPIDSGPIDSGPLVVNIKTFLSSGCGCKRKCSAAFSESEVYSHVLNVRDMKRKDRDMYAMSTIASYTEEQSTKRGKKRERQVREFRFKGDVICKKTLMLLFDIGKHTFLSLCNHVSENGVVPRLHANTGKKPSNALTCPDARNVIQFLSNYAEKFGVLQSAALRGDDDLAPIHLKSNLTKSGLHERYEACCLEASPPHRAVKYSTFNNIWRSCLGHIQIAIPSDDECAACERMRMKVKDAVLEEEKVEAAANLKEHGLAAQKESDIYNKCIKQSRESYHDPDIDNYVHYTFDFCQNVSIPHHSQHVGPLYFVNLRKVQIFGYRIDGIPKQLNFLIDENETINQDGAGTHGPNAIISMMHWVLETNHDWRETSCSLHANNCPGNKNRYVIGYLMWRVMTGRHSNIEYVLQNPGHVRCLVNSDFASFRELYQRSDCDTIDQLQDIVNKSSPTNTAVRYPAWQWLDWEAFLEPVVKATSDIRNYQYFRMRSQAPGELVVRTTASETEEKRINILRDRTFHFGGDMPPIIPAGGLSLQRQLYLHRSVDPFMRPSSQDITCPATPTPPHPHYFMPNTSQI